jgi:hypothetical protein
MKKLTATLLAACGLVFAAPAFASGEGECHFHGSAPASKDTVSSCAVKHRQALVANGKIDKTWSTIKPATLEQVDGKKGKEWQVTFKDPAASDKSKETLYMFFTLQGNLIAANFTGK